MAALLALLSSGLWGVADYVAGKLARRRSVLVVVGGVQLVGLLMMIAVTLVTAAWDAPLDYVPDAFLGALGGGLGLACFYRALALGPMGVVAPVGSLGVIVPVAFGVATGERPSVVQIVGIGVAVLGVVLASGPELSGSVGRQAVMLALAAAALLGLSQIAMAMGSQSSVIMTMTVMRVFTVAAALLIAGVLLVRPGRVVRSTNDAAGSRPVTSRISRPEARAFVLAGVCDASATLAFGAASTQGLLTLVAVFSSLYPVATILLARFIDGERLRTIQKAGVGMALAGAVAISAG